MAQLINNLSKRKKELRTELTLIERQLFDLETTYLEEYRDYGTVFSGWRNLTDSSSGDKVKLKKNVSNEEKLFSLSSITSPASRKVLAKEVGEVTKKAKLQNAGTGGEQVGDESQVAQDTDQEVKEEVADVVQSDE